MVSAPGESRGCSLDAMLPVVLGSLAGLLLAFQPSSEGEVRGRDGGEGVWWWLFPEILPL